MGDPEYFPGVVALLNSLRITGHEMPLTVLDLGFTDAQRRLLEPHCDLHPAERDRPPHLLKLVAPLAAEADVVLLLDSDMVIVAPLTEMIEAATAGRVFAYGDQLAEQRWFVEWQDVFGLATPCRRERYVNSGAVALSTRKLPGFLERWNECCEAIAGQPVMEASVEGPDDPVWLADQDALNALLLSEVDEDQVWRGSVPGMTLGPDVLAQTVVEDLATLHCRWQGASVTVLHAVGSVKPWSPRAVREFRRTAYTACLRRVLWGPGATVRIPPSEVVPWLRPARWSRGLGRALHGYDRVARATRPLRRRVGLSAAPAPRDVVPEAAGG